MPPLCCFYHAIFTAENEAPPSSISSLNMWTISFDIIWTPIFKTIFAFLRCMISLTSTVFLSRKSTLFLNALQNSCATDLGFCSCVLVLAISLCCLNWFVYYQCCLWYSCFKYYFYLQFQLNFAHFCAETLLASLHAMKTFVYLACYFE